MKKRVVAVLLALSVMLTLLPGAAMAAEAGGEGTETLPPAVETETGGEAETGPSYEEEAESPPASGAEDPVPAEQAPEEQAPPPEEPGEAGAALLEVSADGYTLVSTEEALRQALWESEDPDAPVYIRLTADIELSNPLNLYDEKSVTLDLNGHELSSPAEYSGGCAVSVGTGASLTLRNGRVDGGDGQAVNVYGGTLAMENVTVTAALPVSCSGDRNAAGETVPGTITYIKGCRLEGTPSSAGAQRGYDGLNVDNGRVELIENTYIQGGHCGIGVHQGSSIGTITTNPNGGTQRTTITGGNTGIFVDIGTIGTIENCDILYTGTIEEGKVSNRYGLELADGSVSSIAGCKINGIGLINYIGQNGDERVGKIELLSGCEIQGPVVVYGKIDSITNCMLSQGNDSAADTLIEIRGGDVGTIENCTLEIPSADGGSRPGYGVRVNAGYVGTIAGCQFTSSADQLIAIFIGEASVDEITGNTFTIPASSTSGPCNMLNISFTGALGKLGANTAGGTGGRMTSSGIIREITAPGAWDANNKRLFTSASGNWSLWNNGTIGEAVRVGTEAALRSALEGGSVHLVLTADIGLSSLLAADRNFVLDLGGHTLTGAVKLTESNSIIRNGTIAAPAGNNSPAVSVTDASLEMEQVAVTGIRPLAVASADGDDSGTRAGYINLINCQIIGSDVPAGEPQPETYCGILIEGFANVNVQGSTVTGGFVGIRQNAAAPQDETGRYTALYIYGSDVGSLSALPGACAIENVSGVIEGVYNTTLRTAGGANTAAIRNRAAGIIRYLTGDIRTDGSNAIYSEGPVEAIEANGEWKNNKTVFEADAGWALYLGSSSSLTALDAPTNLRWGDGTNLPTGAMAWDMGENEGSVAVKVWRREGTYEAPITSYILEVSREAGPVLDENLLYDASLYFPWSPGTYYFTVQALGDYVTAASSAIAASPDWTYTAPASRLQVEEIPWNGQQIAFKSVDADLAKTYAYKTQLFCNVEGESEARLIATNTDRAWSEQTGEYIPTSLTLEWFKDRIKEAGSPKGEYYLYVTAISMDVNTAWNGEYWTQHTAYPSEVQGTLEDLVKQENATPQEIQQALAAMDTEKLLDAMTEENGDKIAGMLQQLEDKIAAQGVTSKVEVMTGAPAQISQTGVSIVGAALNADLNSTPGETGSVAVTLKIEAASATAPAIPEGMYTNTVSFSMTMEGVANANNLAVPVQITLPVPEGIDTSKLVIFHHHGGTTETVPFQIIEKDGKTFAVFCVAGFSDFTMTESVSGVSLGRLTVNEDGSGSVKASGSGFTLAVASYDEYGKMLEMKTFSVSGSQTVPFQLTPGQTVKAFALAADGSWTPVSLAAAG